MGTLTLRNLAKSEPGLRGCPLREHTIADTTHKSRLHVTFIDKEGEEHTFGVAKGDNLLDIAQANDLEMEGIAT